ELILHTARRLEGALELIARIQGELRHPTVFNVTVNAEWLTLQTAIVRALLPYPDARAAVASALEPHGVVAA
ncbi:MAG: hypothetical protein ACREL3_11505, partial [Gemmatimonadales bacterium]